MTMKNKGIIAILCAAMIWGGGFIATSFSLDSFSTLTLLSIRFTSAAGLLFIVFYKKIKLMTLNEFLLGVPLGIFLFIAFVTQTYALNFTSVANNSFITALNVIFTPYIVWFFYKIKPTNRIFSASILSLIGVAILTIDALSFSINKGDIITFIAAISFSFHIVWAKKMSNVDFRVTTFIQMLVAGIFATIFAIIFDPPLNDISTTSLYSLLYLIIFATLICYLLQMFGTKYVDSSLVSILLSTEALFATVFSIILLGETLNIKSLISILFLTISVLIASTDNSQETIDSPEIKLSYNDKQK